MSHDALAQWGLSPVTPADRATLEPYFASLAAPLSDYTFSQLFTWRNSLRIAWAVLDNHLCVFANGSGDLTLLIPPIGDTNSDRALTRATEIMNDYNAAHHVPDRTRVEYVSEELLARFDSSKLVVAPQGNDYLYDVNRMIDLQGGDLSSKRQAKNRFMRNYTFRPEAYDKAKHFEGCRELLNAWKERQDDAHAGETSNAIKRTKESLATQLTLEHADALGLKGMVVYVNDAEGVERLKGFTFGEALGGDQSSIVVEKTDLECKGLAQYIFSEFC
ncbi:MAG: phosphatidylglycerol lysyltransferase domain-containing protein, partial [Phycisphaerae bacterium]